jgi:hypothetical protein
LDSLLGDYRLIPDENEKTLQDLVSSQTCGINVNLGQTTFTLLDTCGSYVDACAELCNYFQNIATDITTLINFKTSGNDLETKYTAALTEVTNKIEESEDFMNGVGEALDPLMSEDSDFFAIFNCGFIKNDIIIFCDRFSNQFYECCYSIFISCVLSGLAAYIGIYFLWPSVYRFSKEARGEEPKKQEQVRTDSKIPMKKEQKVELEEQKMDIEEQKVDIEAKDPVTMYPENQTD